MKSRTASDFDVHALLPSDIVANTKNAPAQLDYLWAPKYSDLAANLLEYHSRVVAEAKLARDKLTYVVFAGFWEDQQKVPDEYLRSLDVIRAAAKALVVIGVPRVRGRASTMHISVLLCIAA